jgi:hypothetical protein
MDSLNDLRNLLILYRSIQYFVIDSLNDCQHYWWRMQRGTEGDASGVDGLARRAVRPDLASSGVDCLASPYWWQPIFFEKLHSFRLNSRRDKKVWHINLGLAVPVGKPGLKPVPNRN